MSACDSCPVPGHCCRSITLSGGDFAREAASIEAAQAQLDQANADNAACRATAPPGGPIPFRPLFRRSDGAWVWWCPNLNAKTGRCDDYANRPYACIHYEPGTDRLCVLFEPRSKAPDPHLLALIAEAEALE